MDHLTERTVDVGGFATHFWETAPAAEPDGTVVLVHDGAFGSDGWTTWAGVMRVLGESYRVLAPDMLGFGGTDKVVYFDRSPYVFRAGHLADFCATVGVGAEGAHFVGHSLGGSLVLRALASPSSTLPARSGVSISGSGGPWRSKEGMEELGRFDGTEDDVRRLLHLMVDDYAGLDEAVGVRYENTCKPGHVEACLSSRLKHPTLARPPADDGWPDPLRQCSVPILVVSGERDVLLEPDWVSHFEGLSPRIAVERLDAKHAPNMDQPEVVARLLQGYFAGEDGRTAVTTAETAGR